MVAMEMAQTGNWLVPTINEQPYYNKPPGFNWVVAACYKVFGTYAEWATRLPAALAFLLMGVVQFFWVRRFLGPLTGLLAALFTVTSADLLFYGSVNAGEIDLFFSLLIQLQMLALFWYWNKKQWLTLFAVSYAVAAVGFLVKPPALLFQGFTLLALVAYQKRWRVLFSWQHAVGLAVFTAIVGGYFWLYDARQGSGLAYLVHLFAEGKAKTGAESAWYDVFVGAALFPTKLLQLMAPWSVLVIFWFRKGFFKEVLRDRLLRFAALFIAANIWLYWINDDVRMRYLYMFVPFFCTLLAHFAVRYAPTWKRMYRIVMAVFYMAVLALAFGLMLAWLILTPFDGTADAYEIVLAVAMLGLAWLFEEVKYARVNAMVALTVAMLLGRVAFNYTVLPYTDTSEALTYKERVGELLAVTGSEPVYWSGVPHQIPVQAALGGQSLVDTTLTTAPLLAYQLPYYIAKGNGHLLRWHKTLQPATLYLMEENRAKALKLEPLYQLRDRWLSKELVLVRTSATPSAPN